MINEVQITAARTGQYAGLDPARFGPDVTRVFAGRARTDNGWQEVQVEVTYPEWAEVTVHRLVDGVRCPFSETVFWNEAYSRAGGASSEVPNAMWVKRPRGQLLKCARAASLRAAFPEESDYTAEEMSGKTAGPEELTVNRNVAPMEAKPSIAPEAVEQIESLVKRAARSRAWASATEYFRQRFQGADLAPIPKAFASRDTCKTAPSTTRLRSTRSRPISMPQCSNGIVANLPNASRSR